MRAGEHRFHRDLPVSSIWGFEGTVPGPSIEAERGQPVTVEWRNELEGPFPVSDTVAPQPTDADGVPVQCLPGLSGGEPERHTAGLTGHTVVHLHGGLTPASYDGWAENIFAPGQAAVFHYPMDQRAALLWYHDHVMGITKFDVYAGLAGLWIVRDDRERDLGLSEGPPFEVPLLIQDRNFNVDEQGRLTGRLVHKTDPEVMEAFPPFTRRERQGLAGPRRSAGDLPLPRAQRLQRPHVSARAAARRRSGTRADHADRDGPRTPPHPGPGAGGRARARRRPSAPTCSSTSPTSRPGAS